MENKIVYVLGTENDPYAWEIAKRLKNQMKGVKFVKTIDPSTLPMVGKIIVMDIVKGIKKPTILSLSDLKERRIFTLHDFDAGTFLTLMKEIRNVEFIIIGIPEKTNPEMLTEIKELINSSFWSE